MRHAGAGRVVAAADQRAHARLELGQVERLGHVVVGAEVEACHAIFERVARREDQHRRRASAGRAAAAARTGRRPSGSAMSSTTRSYVVVASARFAASPSLDEIDCIGRLVQRARERRRQDGVVFDDQDSHCALRVGCRGSAAVPLRLPAANLRIFPISVPAGGHEHATRNLCYIAPACRRRLPNARFPFTTWRRSLASRGGWRRHSTSRRCWARWSAPRSRCCDAERGSVWLYDAATNELVLEVATGIRPVRVPTGSGLVGACARERRDHQRPRLLRGSAVRSESRQGLRLSDALHADAATCRPQGCAGRRHAGAEQARTASSTPTTRCWPQHSPRNAPSRCSACG